MTMKLMKQLFIFTFLKTVGGLHFTESLQAVTEQIPAAITHGILREFHRLVYDEDIGQDKRTGVTKLAMINLEPGTATEHNLRLLPSHDMLKTKDKKDRGTLTIQVVYNEFSKEEQLKALEEEKTMIEKRKKLKEEGLIGSTMDALDGAVSVVGSVVVLMGTGIGAGVGLVGSGLGAVGSCLSKAGRFMSRI